MNQKSVQESVFFYFFNLLMKEFKNFHCPQKYFFCSIFLMLKFTVAGSEFTNAGGLSLWGLFSINVPYSDIFLNFRSRMILSKLDNNFLNFIFEKNEIFFTIICEKSKIGLQEHICFQGKEWFFQKILFSIHVLKLNQAK